jgi:DNA/RNA-binding domain of Phe-tRNA-synthetase-like protein
VTGHHHRPLAITVEPHPLLELGAFAIRTAFRCGELPTPAPIAALAVPGAAAPLAPTEAVKTAVRDLLRYGGYKPSGRSKPASEYLAAALGRGEFPRINALVDACNVVSVHAGLPISLVDAERLDRGRPLTVRIAPPGTSYAFNPAGQTIDVGGLICLFDAQGPTGTPVKDAQRTKTHDATRAALVVIWGTVAAPGLAAETTRWYRALLGALPDATHEDVQLTVRTGGASEQ